MLTIFLALLFLGSLYLRLKKSIIPVLMIMVIFTAIGVTIGMDDLIQKRFTNSFEDGSWLQRVELYKPAIDAFVENPVTGIGVGSNYSWQLNYPEIGGNRSRVVHSTYLLVMSEVGLAGLVLFFGIIFYWLNYLWVCMRNPKNEHYVRGICMSLLAYSIGYFVYISAVGEFEDFEPWLVMAIASAVHISKFPTKKIPVPHIEALKSGPIH